MMTSPPLRGLRPASFALFVMVLGGCEGSNLFVQQPIAEGPGVPPEEVSRAEILRYIEEATLLTSDDSRLRFRWMTVSPPVLVFDEWMPEPERDAFRRAMALIADAGGPTIVESVFEDGSPWESDEDPDIHVIRVRALRADEYREYDPTRPWSFSRTIVFSSVMEGITGVSITVSRGIARATLDRAALHALGHAVGLMGHPVFPGERFVMASSPRGAPPPTTFDPWERVALRFLYSPGVAAGMTRAQLRAAWAAFEF